MASPKCPHCGGILVPQCIGGMALFREGEDGKRTYNTRCLACGRDTEVVRTTDFPAIVATPFQTGRRWLAHSDPGRARFWFVIIGPSRNENGKPSAVHKQCRIEVHPDDRAFKVPGYKHHGRISTYSHKHLKTWAYLQPVV